MRKLFCIAVVALFSVATAHAASTGSTITGNFGVHVNTSGGVLEASSLGDIGFGSAVIGPGHDAVPFGLVADLSGGVASMSFTFGHGDAARYGTASSFPSLPGGVGGFIVAGAGDAPGALVHPWPDAPQWTRDETGAPLGTATVDITAPSPIPLPPAMALIACGLGALGLARHRQAHIPAA